MDNYILGLLITQIVAVGFAFGKLWQKVSDMAERLKRLEGIQNSKDRDTRQQAEHR